MDACRATITASSQVISSPAETPPTPAVLRAHSTRAVAPSSLLLARTSSQVSALDRVALTSRQLRSLLVRLRPCRTRLRSCLLLMAPWLGRRHLHRCTARLHQVDTLCRTPTVSRPHLRSSLHTADITRSFHATWLCGFLSHRRTANLLCEVALFCPALARMSARAI